MAQDAEEIVIGSNGSIYTAPLGSTIPASVGAAFGGEWSELGYATEDGVTWTDGKTVQDIRAWQSFYALRRIVTEKSGTLAFSLMQWNTDTVQLAFGGGEVTETAPGEFQYTPPGPEELDERMCAVEWLDGDETFRVIFPRGIVSETVEVNVTRSQEARLPITFALLPAAGQDPFIFQTNSDAFQAAS